MESLSIVKHKFSQEEDEELKTLAEKLSYNWRQISKAMPGRTSRQCRERYKYFLSPDICQKNWSEEEDMILSQRFMEFGPKWATIAQFLDGRTPVSAKNRFKKLSRNKKVAHSMKKRKYHYKEESSPKCKRSYNRVMLSLPVPISQLSVYIS